MLLFTRAESNPKYQNFFKINAENSERFGSFDDANFEYKDTNGKTKFRIFQIKHKIDETKCLNKTELLRHKDFKLSKYFRSFLEIKAKNGTDDIQHFILLTNLKIGDDCNQLIEEIKENDDILSLTIPEIHSTSRHILQTPDHKISERKIPKRYKLKLNESDEFYNLLKSRCNENNDLISEFQQKFIIASGQPNEKEMDDILKNRLSKLSRLPISDLVGSHFMNIFLDWLKNKCNNDSSLTHANMKEIIPFLKIKYENLITTNRYFGDLRLIDVKYKMNDPTIIEIKKYFESKESKENLFISTEFPKLTIAKIYQCLETETERNNNSECLIIESRSLDKNFLQKLENVKYFRFCVIICENIDHREIPKINHSKVIILTSNRMSFIDSVLFQRLDLSTKENLLQRFVTFDGEQIRLSEIASIELLDDLNDSKWLYKLTIDDKLIVQENEKFIDEKLYIERFLIKDLYYPNRKSENEIILETKNLIILSANSGMGKTTLLLSLCKKIKKINQSNWTEIIKITDHLKALSHYKYYNGDCIDFLSFVILKHDYFSNQLFKYNFKNVFIMFDAIDEISSKFRKIVVDIVTELLKTDIKQIWMSTRPFVQQYLENEFSVSSWNIEVFSEANQIQLLNSYWMKNGIHRVENDIKNFLYQINFDFEISIPLHTQMIAEYFQNDLNDKFNQLRISDRGKVLLYTKTINRKYSEYSQIKIKMDLQHKASREMHKQSIKKYNLIHGKLAMKLLFPEILPKYDIENSEIIIINAIGIATISNNGKYSFIHKTYAEYFVAHFIFQKLNDEIDDEILDFMLFEITKFAEDKMDEIKKFLNEFLSDFNYSTIFLNKVKDRLIKYMKKQSFENNDRLKLSKNYTGNIFEIIYKAIKLLEPKYLKKYRKFFPIIIWHKTSSNQIKFLEILIEENSEIMQYDLNESFYLEEILQIDSVKVLEKFLIALEKQLDSKQIKDYLTVKYSFVNDLPTYLFYLQVNCSNYFLNYLKKHITPIEDFKQFVLYCNVYYHTFVCQCTEKILDWFKNNVDDDFYQLLIRLRNSKPNNNLINDRFSFYYTEVLNSQIFNEITLYQNVFLQAIKNIKIYEELANQILDKFIYLRDQCIKSKNDVQILIGKEEDVKQILKYGRNASFKFVVKLLKFYMSIYYLNMDKDLYVKLKMISLENDRDYTEDLLSWFSHHILLAARDKNSQKNYFKIKRFLDELKKPKLKYRRSFQHLYVR